MIIPGETHGARSLPAAGEGVLKMMGQPNRVGIMNVHGAEASAVVEASP